jgi:hypothetical protein
VVEEHVSGKYEDDLQYYEGKSKEIVEIETKIMTKEELLNEYYEYVEQTETGQQKQPIAGSLRQATEGLMKVPVVSNTQGGKSVARETQFSLSPASPTLPSENWTGSDQYIANWIQTENLLATADSAPSSPDSAMVLSGHNLTQSSTTSSSPVQEDREEQDRSDESVIVSANSKRMMMQRSNSIGSGHSIASSTGSGSVYKHMADYLKMKQHLQTKEVDSKHDQRGIKQTETKRNSGKRETSTASLIDKSEDLISSSLEMKTAVLNRPNISSQERHRQHQEEYTEKIITEQHTFATKQNKHKEEQHNDKRDASSMAQLPTLNKHTHEKSATKDYQNQQKEGEAQTHEYYKVSDTYKIVKKEPFTSQNQREEDMKANTILNNVVHGTDDDIAVVNKQYRITQQEIIFYLKKADGVIKVVRRPLLNAAGQHKDQLREAEVSADGQRKAATKGRGRKSSSSSGASSNLVRRHLSQPDLRRSSPPSHVVNTTVMAETYRVEQYENVVVPNSPQHQQGWDHLDHLENVGLLHHHHQHGPSHHGQVKMWTFIRIFQLLYPRSCFILLWDKEVNPPPSIKCSTFFSNVHHLMGFSQVKVN